MADDDPSRISPTAEYTGYVWYRRGLSHRALVSRRGAVLYAAMRPFDLAYERILGGPGLESMLIARHRAIDALLERSIARGDVSQVLEVAAGFSPRGVRFASRFAGVGLRYVEADLEGQAARKREALARARLFGPNHSVVALDALRDDGPLSLDAVAAAHLDPSRGAAIVTEGLLGYFDGPTVRAMWRRFARCLARFPKGLYLADLSTGGDVGGLRAARALKVLLGWFARGKTHLHFASIGEARDALLAEGFAEATLHDPADVDPSLGRRGRPVVRAVEAWVARIDAAQDGR